MYTNHPDIVRLAQRAFPDYNGKKFEIKVATHPINCSSYWSGGTRSFFRFMRLSDEQVTNEMPQQSAFDPTVKGLDSVTLVPGLICLEHCLFCGKDMGIRIYYHQDNAPKQLELQQELSYDEKVVLYYTRYYKSSYAGIKNYRLYEALRDAKITEERWNVAKDICLQKGYLNWQGAITNEGRNVIEDIQGEYQLKENINESMCNLSETN
jgi:hypothetical protein